MKMETTAKRQTGSAIPTSDESTEETPPPRWNAPAQAAALESRLAAVADREAKSDWRRYAELITMAEALTESQMEELYVILRRIGRKPEDVVADRYDLNYLAQITARMEQTRDVAKKESEACRAVLASKEEHLAELHRVNEKHRLVVSAHLQAVQDRQQRLADKHEINRIVEKHPEMLSHLRI